MWNIQLFSNVFKSSRSIIKITKQTRSILRNMCIWIENSTRSLKEALYIHATNQGNCSNNFLFKQKIHN